MLKYAYLCVLGTHQNVHGVQLKKYVDNLYL